MEGDVRSLTRNICLLIKSERFNEGFNNKMDDYFFIVYISINFEIELRNLQNEI